MSILPFALTIIVLALAFLHMLWAFGIHWPIRNERALAHAIAGFKGQDKMPPRPASALVAIALLLVAIWPFIGQSTLQTIGLFAIAAGLILRGLLAFNNRWRAFTPVQPFASYDRRYYGPLCLGLGIGYLILANGGLS